ncbi:hypothetical protein [Bacteroides sp. UBA939]|uniref:hypothetical protein n=1 Tax=Bacteroides sp. UBA939 TaxID=1946092 RepID=UPI0025C6746B|nr:hypothetical protein [Bacteroides sp. UBA939]
MLLEYLHSFPEVLPQEYPVTAFHAGNLRPFAVRGQVVGQFTPGTGGNELAGSGYSVGNDKGNGVTAGNNFTDGNSVTGVYSGEADPSFW